MQTGVRGGSSQRNSEQHEDFLYCLDVKRLGQTFPVSESLFELSSYPHSGLIVGLPSVSGRACLRRRVVCHYRLPLMILRQGTADGE